MTIANVALTNTFDTWRIRTNQVVSRLNQFAVNNSRLYANTLTANVRFVSIGSTRLGTTSSNRTIVNGLLTANGNLSIVANTTANRITISNILTVGGNTTTNRLTVSNILTSSGNTTLGDAAADRLTLNGNTVTLGSAVLNIDTGLLFLQRNSNRIGINTLNPNTALDVNGIIRSNTGFRYPNGVTITSPLLVFFANGSQAFP